MMDDQLTRCPHCKTSFLITEADLQSGCGVARCGACLKIFSATSHLFTLEEIGEDSVFGSAMTSQPSTDQDLSSEIAIETDANQAFAADPLELEQPAFEQSPIDKTPSTASQAEPQQIQDQQTQDQKPAPPLESEVSAEPQQQTLAPEQRRSAARTPVMEALDVDLELDELRQARNSRPLSERIEAEEPNLAGPPPEGFEEVYYNGNAEEADSALTDFDMTPVVPPERPKEPSKTDILLSKPVIATAAVLSLAILAFLILLGSTRSLSQNPKLNGVVETLCAISSCSHPLMEDFKPLAATQTSLSQSDNSLIVDFVLENPSENTLPFPGIIVELLNEEGLVVGAQHFQPDLYLKNMPFADHQLPPELPVAITLNVTELPPQAEDFRLTFIPPLN